MTRGNTRVELTHKHRLIKKRMEIVHDVDKVRCNHFKKRILVFRASILFYDLVIFFYLKG